MTYTVDVLWDDDAKVWIATSDDIPGLVLESGSYDALIERVKIAAPELLALDNQKKPVTIKCRSERVIAASA